MDISAARCAGCNQAMTVSRMVCSDCGLSPEDQLFVVAFVRHHGSIKKMESLFDISYPTVKNRLNAIGRTLDKSFEAPSPHAAVLEQLARGEITVDEALDRIG